MDTKQLDIIHGDRRSDNRYELDLDLQFSYDRKGHTVAGVGKTVDLSSGGVSFAADDAPPVGTLVQLRIQWPYKLRGICPLQLVVTGEVRRHGVKGIAIKTVDYEFKTCGPKSFELEPIREPLLSMVV